MSAATATVARRCFDAARLRLERALSVRDCTAHAIAQNTARGKATSEATLTDWMHRHAAVEEARADFNEAYAMTQAARALEQAGEIQ